MSEYLTAKEMRRIYYALTLLSDTLDKTPKYRCEQLLEKLQDHGLERGAVILSVQKAIEIKDMVYLPNWMRKKELDYQFDQRMKTYDKKELSD